MKALVIGNGFDIAHKLPTRYSDFIYFLEKGKEKYEKWAAGNDAFFELIKGSVPQKYDDAKNPDNWKVKDWLGIDTIATDTANHIGKILLDVLGYSDISSSDIEGIFGNGVFKQYNYVLIWFYVKGNRWYDYFRALRGDGVKNWCDIENCIYEVIKTFTESDIAEVDETLFTKLRLDNNDSVDVINKCLYDDLRQLADYLEIYLTIFERVAAFVKTKLNMATGYKPLQKDYIKAINPDMIVSLNYTTIYPIIYDNPDVKIHYVHGQVGHDNMVFGIKSVASGKYKDCVFKKFNKVLQMSEYRLDYVYNGSIYKDGDLEVHIFGCSLSTLDEHIFVPIFSSENLRRCVIYCLKCDEDKLKANVDDLLYICGNHAISKKIEYQVI